MGTVTEQTGSLRAAITANRAALADVLVDLDPGAGNELLRIAGIGEEFSCILGVRVDVVSDSLLREQVSASAHRDAVAL